MQVIVIKVTNDNLASDSSNVAVRVLDRDSDYLRPGHSSDSRLFHADSADHIQVYSPDIGQGYIQTIPLRDDLSLVILDHTFHDTLVSDNLREHAKIT
ncbi:MAG: hypothetical protein AAGA75_19585 [Cyanobacteria bacterium P01_E01_bin.6]